MSLPFMIAIQITKGIWHPQCETKKEIGVISQFSFGAINGLNA
jgi:hypothetical protein